MDCYTIYDVYYVGIIGFVLGISSMTFLISILFKEKFLYGISFVELVIAIFLLVSY